MKGRSLTYSELERVGRVGSWGLGQSREWMKREPWPSTGPEKVNAQGLKDSPREGTWGEKSAQSVFKAGCLWSRI